MLYSMVFIKQMSEEEYVGRFNEFKFLNEVCIFMECSRVYVENFLYSFNHEVEN